MGKPVPVQIVPVHHGVTIAPNLNGARRHGQQRQDGSAGLTIRTSRHWVLPPRPKPGRKPSCQMLAGGTSSTTGNCGGAAGRTSFLVKQQQQAARASVQASRQAASVKGGKAVGSSKVGVDVPALVPEGTKVGTKVGTTTGTTTGTGTTAGNSSANAAEHHTKEKSPCVPLLKTKAAKAGASARASPSVSSVPSQESATAPDAVLTPVSTPEPAPPAAATAGPALLRTEIQQLKQENTQLKKELGILVGSLQDLKWKCKSSFMADQAADPAGGPDPAVSEPVCGASSPTKKPIVPPDVTSAAAIGDDTSNSSDSSGPSARTPRAKSKPKTKNKPKPKPKSKPKAAAAAPIPFPVEENPNPRTSTNKSSKKKRSYAEDATEAFLTFDDYEAPSCNASDDQSCPHPMTLSALSATLTDRPPMLTSLMPGSRSSLTDDEEFGSTPSSLFSGDFHAMTMYPAISSATTLINPPFDNGLSTSPDVDQGAGPSTTIAGVLDVSREIESPPSTSSCISLQTQNSHTHEHFSSSSSTSSYPSSYMVGPMSFLDDYEHMEFYDKYTPWQQPPLSPQLDTTGGKMLSSLKAMDDDKGAISRSDQQMDGASILSYLKTHISGDDSNEDDVGAVCWIPPGGENIDVMIRSDQDQLMPPSLEELMEEQDDGTDPGDGFCHRESKILDLQASGDIIGVDEPLNNEIFFDKRLI